jgi:hypothetical protein
MAAEAETAMAAATAEAAVLVAATLAALAAVEPKGQGRVDWLLKMRHHAPEEDGLGPANASPSARTEPRPLPPTAEASSSSDREDHTGKFVYSDLVIQRVASILVAAPVSNQGVFNTKPPSRSAV